MQLHKNFFALIALFAMADVATHAVQAQQALPPDMGKLTATGGVSQLEGAGWGSLTPWALIQCQ